MPGDTEKDFIQVPADTFKHLQIGAALLLKNFDTSSGQYSLADILGATGGGLNFTYKPVYKSLAEGIDNIKNPMTMEFMMIKPGEVKLTGTFKTITADSAQRSIGAADADTMTHKIKPRMKLKSEDFKDLWVVGKYGTQDTPGWVGIHMFNTLSTGGFSMQTHDDDKADFAFEFTGFYSNAEQDKVPYELFIKEGGAA